MFEELLRGGDCHVNNCYLYPDNCSKISAAINISSAQLLHFFMCSILLSLTYVFLLHCWVPGA